MWDVKAKVIPVVMGALGSVPMVIDVEISVKPQVTQARS